MPIKIKREDGSISTYRNAWCIPAFLLIPEELLRRASREIYTLPRCRAALQKQIAAKEQEYDTLMRNMSVMVLAPDILSDIHEKMKTIKEEIKVLENTTPPEEYSTDVILDWLKSIRTAPDSRAVHLLVKRIDVVSDNEKTDFNVVSTLESVSEKLVRVVITDSAAGGHIP